MCTMVHKLYFEYLLIQLFCIHFLEVRQGREKNLGKNSYALIIGGQKQNRGLSVCKANHSQPLRKRLINPKLLDDKKVNKINLKSLFFRQIIKWGGCLQYLWTKSKHFCICLPLIFKEVLLRHEKIKKKQKIHKKIIEGLKIITKASIISTLKKFFLNKHNEISKWEGGREWRGRKSLIIVVLVKTSGS